MPAAAVVRSTGRFRRWGLPVAASIVLVAAATSGLLYLQGRDSATNPGNPVDLPVRVPNFVGAKTDDVVRTAQLLNLQLVMTDQTGRTFDSLKGVVTRQDPSADSEIRKGGTVRVSVEAAVVAVPTLSGATLDQALDALLRLGLALGTTEAVSVTDAPDGTIVSQSPAPGTSVPLGSKVNVSVARRRATSVLPERRTPRQEPVR
jgi:beta-lactam-binding protein with PASTA domain